MCFGIIFNSGVHLSSKLKLAPMTFSGLEGRSTMAPLVIIFITIISVSAYGFSLEGLSPHTQCESDHQCGDGYFCYEESHLCTRCVDCSSYKRKSSWRSCPKTPADCGGCEPQYGEEILHNGRTRDMCIPSSPSILSQTIVSENSSLERIAWAAGITALILPIVYYVFSRKNRIRDRGHIHHDLHREEPPPYRSIELTTLTTDNSVSEEQLSEGPVINVGQQKDHLVQAVPFRKPAYLDEELVVFDNAQNETSEDSDYMSNEVPVHSVSTVELHDENTMPSDWTPDENSNNGQLMSFELTEVEECGCESEPAEPAAKRLKPASAEEQQQQQQQQDHNTHNLSINLFINNNVTIHKPQ